MTPIEEQILLYDELSPSERAEVDGYLAAHPAAAALLTEGRALRVLLGEVAQGGERPPSAAVLAEYVVARQMGNGPLPPHLAELEGWVEQAAAEQPEVARQVAQLQDRLDALLREAADPLAHFAKLSGRRLDRPAEPAPGPPTRHRSWRAPSRGPRPLLRRLAPTRLALVAILLGGFLFGGLHLLSEVSRPPYERLAALHEASSQFEGLRLRGGDGRTDPAADRYAAALDRVHDARSDFLGLFPTYDAAGLDEAMALLTDVTEMEPANSALGLEAWYLIGRIRLHRGETEAAEEALTRVVEREGPSAPAAQRLLRRIRPAQGDAQAMLVADPS